MTKKLLTILILFNTTFCFSQNWERIDSIFAPSGVTVSSFTAPVFGDLDGDNDLDLILGSFDDKIHFFENIGSAVNPKFKEDTSVISPIYANGFQFTNSYYPALVDLDNDSDFDLVIGGYNKLLYYANIGNQLNPIFQKGDTTIFSNVNIDIGTDARQAFADLDNDGDMDLIVGIGESLFGGPTAGISMGFRNIGTTTSPMFQRDDALVSGIPDVGLNAYPALADLDNDGDYDLLIGRDGLTFYYYKNNGNSSAPVWSREFTTFANIESTNYWKDPTFADLDGDSDFDLIYGTDDGKINFYEDTGSAASPQFQFNPEYFVIHKVDGSSTVSFADFDSDGDLDLLSGSLFNNLQYFQNMGTSAQPKFEKKSTIFTSLSIGSRLSPLFIDIDKDNDFDIITGATDGKIYCYINNGNSFIQNTTIFSGIQVNYQSVPAFVDIEKDGDFDLLVGSDDAGDTKFYINDGKNNFTINTTFFSTINFPGRCRPSFADIDNDGDLDLFIGRLFGNIDFYENTGTKTNPVWTLNNALTNEINVKQSAHPGFADLNGDGRLDLIVGEADGNFNYFKNLFANPLPVELTTFIANLSGKSITLNWTTSTETNNLGFEIQRKTFKDSQWQTIGFKDGNGTTVETKSYSYVDNINELSSEKIFYRLKQVDFNGNFKFSNEIEVNIAPAKFSLEQNYPNPFNPTTKIKYSISTSPQTPLLAKERDKGEVVTLKIYDILGNEITSLVNREQQPGNYEIEFDGSKLGSGVYVYTLKAGNYISSKKMTLMK